MNQRIDAIFENGVFRPEVPVSIANGERVSLDIEPKSAMIDELDDIKDLIDAEFVETCQRHAGQVPPLAEVRKMLSTVDGSLAERIIDERNER